MLEKMWEFDSRLILERYEEVVSAIENRRACGLDHKH